MNQDDKSMRNRDQSMYICGQEELDLLEVKWD